jgi:hypothetical protein
MVEADEAFRKRFDPVMDRYKPDLPPEARYSP